MSKIVCISLIYQFEIKPEDIGIDDNCSKEKLWNIVNEIIDKKINIIAKQANIIPEKIETEIIERKLL